LAELAAKYLHKGSLIHLEGSLRTRSWEDKDKNKRFITEIIGTNLVMLDKRSSDHRHEFEDLSSEGGSLGTENGNLSSEPPY
ncbi:MAG TPA: single-stranded DNA-binding protein, partial [Chitinophagaceae bacterium]|nr:single-stranded DNA-binding protein [Chitinophagaceae bacterium]